MPTPRRSTPSAPDSLRQYFHEEKARRAAEEMRGERAAVESPFPRSLERHYDRLAAHTAGRLTGRALWRILHATPLLKTGRAVDLADRLWRVPSSRRSGTYLVNLYTGQCALESGEACPEIARGHKAKCCHFLAALQAEAVRLGQYDGGSFGKELREEIDRRACVGAGGTSQACEQPDTPA